MVRSDGRAPDQLRPVRFEVGFQRHADGSVLIECGETRVLCSVSRVPGVPRWMREQQVPGGWLTSEYQMLPGSTTPRTQRDLTRGRPNGRSQEIQRLVGRSLRAAVALKKLGDNTFYVDCDVLDADGGTRCAAINGAVLALQLALRKLFVAGALSKPVTLATEIAAVSVGIVDGVPLLDLCYEEDSRAETDCNLVMTGDGRFIEIQGTAEGAPFSNDELATMLDLGRKGIQELIAARHAALEGADAG